MRTVEQQIANDLTLNHEYLPVLGLPEFTNPAVNICVLFFFNYLKNSYFIHFLGQADIGC